MLPVVCDRLYVTEMQLITQLNLLLGVSVPENMILFIIIRSEIRFTVYVITGVLQCYSTLWCWNRILQYRWDWASVCMVTRVAPSSSLSRTVWWQWTNWYMNHSSQSNVCLLGRCSEFSFNHRISCKVLSFYPAADVRIDS